jgi:hypothetical protein
MRIATSLTNLSSSSFESTSTKTTENLHAWNKKADFSMNSIIQDSKKISQTINLIDRFEQQSPAATDINQLQQQSNSSYNDPLKKLGLGKIDNISKTHDLRYEIMKQIIERMTGRKVKEFDPGELGNTNKSSTTNDTPDESENQESTVPDANSMKGWGINYERVDTQSSVKSVDFSAQGSVTTEDGRSIDFSATFSMSRETSSELRVSFKDGDALIDPLALDFSGNGASFTSDSMLFDLNSDGTLERIATPSSTTAFLAYDKNGNGIIDNGSELFGPSSGSGFSDLAALDEDHNQWIDENDSAFKNLRLWQRSGNGVDTLRTLAEAGVGALYTGSSSTPFTLTKENNIDSQNSLSTSQTSPGMLRDSGIYLHENGMIGFMQEVDLVV